MSAAPTMSETGRASGFAWPTRAQFARFFIVGSAFLLVALMLFPGRLFKNLPFEPPPMLFVSIAVIVGCMMFRGSAVLGRTALDWIFLAWLLIVMVSFVNAGLGLNRLINEGDFVTFCVFLFSAWLYYRACYALTIVEPRFAVNALLVTLMLGLLSTAFIGLLQNQGPFTQTFIEFAYNWGQGQEKILEGVFLTDRPTSVFGGPVLFGFANLVGAIVCAGSVLAMGRKVKESHAIFALGAVAVFAYANINSQTRSSVVLIAVLGLAVFTMIVMTRKIRVMVFSTMALVLMTIFLVGVARSGNYEYLTSIFTTGFEGDISYQIRADGAAAVGRLAPDIGLLGAGYDRFSGSGFRGYDYWSSGNTSGDTAPVFAFFTLGVPGVVHFVLLHLIALYMVFRMKVDDQPFLARLKYVAMMTVVLFIIVSPTAVRHAKLNTFAYMLIPLGCVGAVLNIQRRMRIAEARRRLSVRVNPEPAASV